MMSQVLPKSLKALLSSDASSLRLKRDEILYKAGEPPTGVYLMEDGLVGLLATTVSKKEHLIRIFRSGDFFGHRTACAGDLHHGTARALKDSEVTVLPIESVQHAMSCDSTIAKFFLELLAQDLRVAELRLCSATDKNVTSRISEALVYLLEQYPSHKWTRREIAEFTGSTTATVIRVINSFEEMGLVKFDGRKIKIEQRDKLLDLAVEI